MESTRYSQSEQLWKKDNGPARESRAQLGLLVLKSFTKTSNITTCFAKNLSCFIKSPNRNTEATGLVIA